MVSPNGGGARRGATPDLMRVQVSAGNTLSTGIQILAFA
jgi:hypothetical protein